MFERYEKDLSKRIEWAVNKSLNTLKIAIDNKTPEDTKTLLWNNKIDFAITILDTTSWKIYNDTPYWLFVEYWVMSKKYNYNKPKWSIFYRWIWARMFTRWFDETKQEILNNIRNVWTQ